MFREEYILILRKIPVSLRSVIIDNNLRATIFSSRGKKQFAFIYTAWANSSDLSLYLLANCDRYRSIARVLTQLHRPNINTTYSKSGEISVWSKSRTISFEGDRFACATCSPERSHYERRAMRMIAEGLDGRSRDSGWMGRSWDQSRSCEITGGRKRTQSVLAARKREPN